MFIVGLTGGIASGKSTVSSILAERGAFIVDADKIGHEVISKGTEGWRKLVECFGEGILDREGNIDRPKLGQVVFGNAKKVARLNQITHPLIIQEIFRRIDRLRKDRGENSIVILDAPLLVEAGGKDFVDLLVLVSSPEELQVERLARDRNMSAEDARKRIAAQARLDEKIKLADIVLENAGTIQELQEKAEKLWQEICRRASQKFSESNEGHHQAVD